MLAYSLEDREGRQMADLWSHRPEGRALTLYEADFIEGLVLQAAVALENARNQKRNLEFARAQQDMDAARAIQRSLLPQRLPVIGGLNSLRAAPAGDIGGYFSQ